LLTAICNLHTLPRRLRRLAIPGLVFALFAATLIFIERSAILPSARPAMKFRILRFRVDCSYEEKRHEKAHWTRAELIAEILREYEHSGDAPLVPS
jgi:hypothetical protein